MAILLGLISCKKDISLLIGTNKDVTIAGELSNIDNNEIQIVVEYKDLVTSELITLISPAKNGTFQFRFPKYNVQDIKLIVGDFILPILVIPGENMHLKINLKNLDNGVLFSGENARLHNDFIALSREFNNYKTSIDSAELKIKTLEPVDYKTYVINNENKLIGFLKNYNHSNSVDPLIFDWYMMHIKYETANQLIYPYNVRFEKFGVKVDYWDFFDKYPVSNEQALFCSDYHQYCTNYYMYLANIRKEFDIAMKYYGNDWKSYYQTNIDKLNESLSGIARDILISNLTYSFMQDDLKSFRDLQTPIFAKIENENVKNLISDRYVLMDENIKSIDLSQKIKIYDYRKDTLKSDILDIIRSKYKNKVIYVDNWASWCGSCIAEMPHSIELQKEFEDKDVIFVFLCSYENYVNDRAKAIISEKQITGEHYLMNFHQSYLNEDRFKSKGIPRYMIINKKGEIVDNDAPRPSSIEIRERLNGILQAN